ncbi:MAG: right-handed parallel beta-helix repeat-containing protein [Methylotenera sp.]|nr:right-handed parallel beta-helix repeat-containing protein [Oligoflexia bacterium]
MKIIFLVLSASALTGCQLAMNQQQQSTVKLNSATAQVSLGTVQPRYSIAADWNDYYIKSAPAMSCSGTETDCEHGGSQKRVTVMSRTSCDGLTMSDQLDAFDWSCDASIQPVTFVGTLKSTKSAADLVTATGWKFNLVGVFDRGVLAGSTDPTLWWSNPVRSLPSATAATQTLSSARTVYVAATTPGAPVKGYNVNSDKISIVFLPGVTLTADNTINSNSSTRKTTSADQAVLISVGSQKFISLEGSDAFVYGIKPTTWALSGGVATAFYVVALRAAHYVRLKNLNIRYGAQSCIQHLFALGTNFDRVTLADAGNYGISENTTSFGRFTNMNSFNNGRELIDMYSTSYTLFDTLFSKDHTIQGGPGGNAGIWLQNGNYDTFRNIEVRNANCTGMSVIGTNNSTFTHMLFENIGSTGSACGANAGNGLYISGGANNNFTQVKVSSAAGIGVFLNATGGHRLTDFQVINNGFGPSFTGHAGIAEFGTKTGGNMSYKNIVTSNNTGDGISILYASSSLSQVLSTHNGDNGITIGAAARSVSATTVAFNGSYGINQSFTNAGTTYQQVLAYKNGLSGLRLLNDSSGVTLSNVASLNNSTYGLEVGTASVPPALVKVVGSLLLNGNTTSNCTLPAAMTGLTNVSSVCAVSAAPPPSGSVVDPGPGVTGSIVGAVLSDTINASNTSGTQAFTSITDWTYFNYFSRTWGKAVASTGACLTGSTCQIWDWALGSSDFLLRNTTRNGIAQNDSYLIGGTCPTGTEGTQYDTTATGGLPFMKLAIEDLSASIGNRNGLCEAGEECVYTPNFGYYQGEGSLASCNHNDAGGIALARMSGYNQNGH